MRTNHWIRAALLASVVATAGQAQVFGQSIPSVDTEGMMRDLATLAADSMAGRETGMPGAERARAFILRTLEETALPPIGDSYFLPFTWAGHPGVDVIARVPGRQGPAADVIVISAHYDHLGIRDGEVFNGADDNASGVAALLEIGRQLKNDPLEHTAILAFFDAEEEGLRGSRAFVMDPPVLLSRIALNVNLDMVSRTYGVLWAAGSSHTPALRPILEGVAKSAPLRLRLGHDRPGAPEGQDWTDSSDHGPFHRMGIPFVYFGVEDHPDYHRPTDEFEKVDPKEFTTAVQTILMALRALDAALPLDGPGAH
jgi:hypothetical protein